MGAQRLWGGALALIATHPNDTASTSFQARCPLYLSFSTHHQTGRDPPGTRSDPAISRARMSPVIPNRRAKSFTSILNFGHAHLMPGFEERFF